MEDTSKKFCSIIFDILEQKGIKDVVCSPGSRNVPLLLAASARASLKKHFVVDERSAGFTGLGMALVSKRPVVLICTSGTALLNYAPSIAEAYYQNIPLIVLSADRPIQWIDQDDSQTLKQDGALDNFVKKSYSIPAVNDDEPELQWYVNRIINEAVLTCLSRKKGPVHINIHLSEPLGLKSLLSNNKQREINILEANSIRNKNIFKDLALKLSKSNVMLVAGFSQPDSELQKVIAEFSKFPNVTVMAETISNLHLTEDNYSIDSVLTAFENEELDKLFPEVVISIGGSLVSRKLKEYLRRNSSRFEHWSIGYNDTVTDPFMGLRLKIELPGVNFFRSVTREIKKIKVDTSKQEYRQLWKEKRIIANKTKQKYVDQSDWSELKAFSLILSNLPFSENLFLSNGTPVRYAQIIKYKLPHASYCNRGVSGIDGSVSTAVGGAISYKEGSLLITGDLSMSYDIGALGLKDVPSNFKIIVIDNQGGGIFRFIPTTSNLEEREEYFCQSPILPLKELAQGYDWDYLECEDEISLKEALPHFFTSTKKIIMRIVCDGVNSAEILKKYMSLKVKQEK